LRNGCAQLTYKMRNEKCVMTGMSEETQSAYEPTVSTCLGHMVAANANVLGPKFSSLIFS